MLSGQELKLGDTCFVPVPGKISTAMRWHCLEILTTQWCEANGSRLQFLAGWSTNATANDREWMAKGPSVRGQGMRLGLCSGAKGL